MKIHRAGSQIRLDAPAKVNLFLEIHGKRDDGFHEIETVMSKVSLFDTLHFIPRGDGNIQLHVCSGHGGQHVPAGPDNLVCRALQLVKSRFESESRKLGAEAWLTKRIPSSAGLGGASSDAAASLVAANHIWDLRLDRASLQSLGSALGSDVPFFLQSGAAVCTGRGEIIQSIPHAAGLPIVIAMPPVGLSTPDIYRSFAEQPGQRDALRKSSAAIQSTLRSGRWHRISAGLFNRLERIAAQMTDWIDRLSQAFKGIPSCLGSQMSGSGSSYFGAFPNVVAARRAASRLSNQLPGVRILLAPCLGPLSGPHPSRANR